jgi:alpha-L-arabinofuranosidase
MCKPTICCVCVFVCLLFGATSAKATVHIDPTTRNQTISARAIVLVENGAAKFPIVVSENADAETKKLASELAGYLQSITGATFEVKTGVDGPGIYVGTLEEFPTPSAVQGLKIYDNFDGKEAFAIRTENDRIKLLGATRHGVPHAVSRFLELIGCRWFFQGPTWEVVPRISRLTFNIDETDRPEVLVRYFGYPLGENYEKGDPDAGAALLAWWRHNRVGKSFQTAVGHCWPEIINRFKPEFEAHPEYRAMVGGVRKGGQLCVSNPRVIRLAIQYAREFFDKHPEADMVGVGPGDGGGYCTCSECASKWSNCGDQAFYLANAVAKALRESHPGKFVGIYAYNWHCDPPTFQMEPNVYVELTTTLLLNTKYGFEELLDRWPKQCKYFGLYDYWACYDWIRDRLPSGRTGNTKYVAEELPLYIRKGTSSLSAESGNSWGSQGLGYYLAARVLWDSKTDTEALKQEFYEKAFGPAAAVMKTYYERVDLANQPLIGPTFYRLCLEDLETAEQAAQGRPDVLQRIAHLKQYHVFVYLLDKTNQPGADHADQKKYALEMLKWNYRIRNTYMTFWSFFADQTTGQLAKRFEEPSWWWWQMHSQRKAEMIPYRNPAPISPAETQQWVREMKTVFGDVKPVADVSFSRNLIAPQWEPAKPGDSPRFGCQEAYCLALASRSGEPLRLTVEHGTIYKNFPDGKYTLTDCKGNVVTSQRLSYGPSNLAIKVPTAGVYLFHYEDFSAGSTLTPSPDTQTAFVLARGERFNLYTHAYLYFYVPKGTKEIHLYARRPHLFGIAQPDGTWVGQDCGKRNPYGIARSLEANGACQTIPVPDGMDGRVWSSVDMVGGHFYFFNIPNLLFARPDHVIVPREVAAKDGLRPADHVQAIQPIMLDMTRVGPNISPLLFGHNLEFTRRAFWQGLSAEMAANRKFAGDAEPDGLPPRWYAITDGGKAVIDKHVALARSQSVRVEVATAGKPAGIGQIGKGIALQKGTAYRFRVWLRAEKKLPVMVRFSGEVCRESYHQQSWVATGGGWACCRGAFIAPVTDRKVRLEITAETRGVFWIGAVSVQPADTFHGMRRDVVALLKELGVGVLRYPGGCFAEDYQWQEGLLPVDERPPVGKLSHLPYSDGYDFQEINTDDYLALCREIGAQPAITIRLGEGTPAEAAAWVEYCNGSADTRGGKLRAARGHPQPYAVRYWFLGNEIKENGKGESKKAEVYVRLAGEFATAMKKADPAIKLIGSGAYYFEADAARWDIPTLSKVGRHFAQYSVHQYVPAAGNGDDELTRVAVSPTTKWRRMPENVSPGWMLLDPVLPRLEKLRRFLDQHCSDSARIGIAFDEWNVWNSWYRTPGAAEGVFAASMLNMLCREGQRLGIDMACYFQPVNEGAILVDAFSSRLTPVGQVFSLLKVHQNNRLLKQLETAAETDVDACASIRDDGSIYVTLVHRGTAGERAVEMALPRSVPPGSKAVARLLVAHELKPDSPFDERTRQVTFEGGKVSVVLPRYSVALISIVH